MIISCPQCATQYNLPDATVRDGAKARCARCKTIFVLRVQVQPQVQAVQALAQPQVQVQQQVQAPCQPQTSQQYPQCQQTLSQQPQQPQQYVEPQRPIVTDGLPPLSPPPPTCGPTFMQGPALAADQRGVGQPLPQAQPQSLLPSQPQTQQVPQAMGAVQNGAAGMTPPPLCSTGDVIAMTGQANLARPRRRMENPNPSAQTDFARQQNQQGNESTVFQSFMTGLLLLVILGMLGFGAWRYMPRLGDTQLEAEVDRIDLLRAQIKDISLHNVRQYTVESNKAGVLLVLEGRIINNFRTPREMVKLEAVLYDKEGNKLESSQQLCGILVSKLQMQIWDASEIEAALDNELEAYEHNVNIASGTSVPFMVVFVDPPSSVASYAVHVVDAQTPPSR